YFQNVADAFKVRYKQLGGKIVQEESFTSFSNTIQNAITRVAPTKAQVIAFPTAFDGLAPFVGGLRALGNNTPIINSWGGDGNYWWPKNPQVKNYYYVSYGSIYGDDPQPAVNRLVKLVTAANGGKLPATGSFIPGADLVDALVYAIKQTHGSTRGGLLRKQFESFKNFPATSGLITYSKTVHGVTGRNYRVMFVNNNKAKVLKVWKTKKDAVLGPGRPLSQVPTPESDRWPGGSLRATAVSRSFEGVDALHDVTLELRRGEVLGLIGPNGAGKTTLVNLMSGF